MTQNLFTFKDDMLLCWRVGPVNAQRQRHFSKEVTINGLGGHHKPPISRGMWAFPYPHFDYFFVSHRYKSLLPKKFRDNKDGGDEKYWAEYGAVMKKIWYDNRPSLFYAARFYSHIFPNGKTDYDDWFYWDCPRDWAREAKGHLISFDGQYKWKYSKDHLEIFVP